MPNILSFIMNLLTFLQVRFLWNCLIILSLGSEEAKALHTSNPAVLALIQFGRQIIWLENLMSSKALEWEVIIHT
jgi:hypothetical protein